ncbi:MAG TPA: carboxypeptidase-like regulatory domain-containing protein [Saprospiraceae bacterium]|nr:carboxypeptidase-like regulatory domain-containing protein [Saprospiraceae bacterium]
MKRILFLAILITFGFACHKDSDITNITGSGVIPEIKVESSISGRVVDELGNPVKGANVKIAGNDLITNDNGLFLLPNKLFNENGEHIRVTKTGYLGNSKFSFQSLGNSSFLEVVLAQKIFSTKFLSPEAKIVNLMGNAQVEFAANSIVDANGQAYNGPVFIYSKFYDISDNKTISLLPGDSRAVDKDGNVKLLESFGMLQIELESPAGEKLNLGVGQTAKISIPVPSSKQSTAPANISFWHLNESNGYWREEGQGSLINGNYVGQVNHFSFWNSASGLGFVKLSGTVLDQTGISLPGIKIQLQNINLGIANGYTDSKGHFAGLVPLKDPMTLTIYDNCTNLLYTKVLSSLFSDTDLGNINVTLQNMLIVNGRLLDCNNIKLQDGIVYFYADNTHLVGTAVTNNEGKYRFAFSNCNNWTNLKAVGFNFSIPIQSDLTDISLNSSVNSIPDIVVCNGSEQFIIIDIDGKQHKFNIGLKLIQGSATNFTLSDVDNNQNDTINLQFTKKGSDFIMSKLYCLFDANVVGTSSSSINCTYCTDQTVCGCSINDILSSSEFGEKPGEICTGSLSGSEAFKSAPEKQYSIIFKVKREN